MDTERDVPTLIKLAIQDLACLSGILFGFRVRFAPHAFGRDFNGKHIVAAFEYGGLNIGQAHWMCLAVESLRGLQRTRDPWRSGPLEERPQSHLAIIEAAVDDSWSMGRGKAYEAGLERLGRATVVARR